MKLETALQKVRDVIRLRHLSISTEDNYCSWITRFAAFVKSRCEAAWTPERKMEAFLTGLAKRDVSASTQNQAFCALLFFYREALGVTLGKVDSLRAKKPVQIRHAPEVMEVKALLESVEDVASYPTRLIVHLLYGCGLRVSEPLNLRVKDVLLAESRLIIRSAKGGKDRVVGIPCSLVEEIRAQLAFARAVSERDRVAGVPVAMPGLLAGKYPRSQCSPKWAWLFPSHRPCVHPRSGAVVRWRCHEANVQRCVRDAARRLGLEVTPHHLRHAYATHALNAGGNPRAIQQAMGHSQLETTMGYLHAEAEGVASPLERLRLLSV